MFYSMNKKFTKRILMSASALCLLSVPAMSQTIPAEQTGIASPDRVGEQIERRDFVPNVLPNVEVREFKIEEAPEGAEDIIFDLVAINVDGATVYSEADLQGLYADKLGQTISLADVYGIAAEITKKYRNDGYITTRVAVPPQVIEGGVVRLQAVEGFIGNIEVRGEGEEESELELIRSYINNVQKKSVLHTSDFERALFLINDLPGVQARAILDKSPTQAGASDLILIITRDDLDGRISIDNYGTRFLGPVQVGASASLNSYFGMNEKITAQTAIGVGIDDFTELFFSSLRYDHPIFDHGTKVSLYGSYTHTEPGFTLEDFNVKGYSRQAYLQVSHPFVRSRSFNVNGRATFDYRDVTSTNNLIGVNTLDDKIRAARLGGNVEFLDTIFGFAFNNLDVEYSKGLDILGATSDDDPDVSRPSAETEFHKLEATFQRLQRVTGNVNLLLAATGQITDEPVLSAEEFGLGGLNFGRGYDPSEVIGDDGFAGKVELQWRNPYFISEDLDYQLFGFFDAGRVFDEDATASSLEVETLTSTGFGARATISEDTNASLMFAVPLNTTPETQDDRGVRAYFSLSRDF